MNRKKFDFPAAVAASLRRLGARPAQCYDWELDTVAGTLRVTPYGTWIACRFDDVEAATQRVRFGTLNPWSGKWNWHFERPNANDVDFFADQIERLLDTAPAPEVR
jgi:hypothetical protein